MIVDFHTLSFPDSIAEKAIKKLSLAADLQPYRDGTVASLEESMRRGGVDVSVVLPVATSESQVQSINNVSAAPNGKNNMYFSGAIHPNCANV